MLVVSSDFKSCLALIFQTGWKICTSFDIPGTNMNIVEFSVAGLILLFVFRHVLAFLGVNVNPSAVDTNVAENKPNSSNSGNTHGRDPHDRNQGFSDSGNTSSRW